MTAIQRVLKPTSGHPTYLTPDEEVFVVATMEIRGAHDMICTRRILTVKLHSVLNGLGKREGNGSPSKNIQRLDTQNVPLTGLTIQKTMLLARNKRVVPEISRLLDCQINRQNRNAHVCCGLCSIMFVECYDVFKNQKGYTINEIVEHPHERQQTA